MTLFSVWISIQCSLLQLRNSELESKTFFSQIQVQKQAPWLVLVVPFRHSIPPADKDARAGGNYLAYNIHKQCVTNMRNAEYYRLENNSNMWMRKEWHAAWLGSNVVWHFRQLSFLLSYPGFWNTHCNQGSNVTEHKMAQATNKIPILKNKVVTTDDMYNESSSIFNGSNFVTHVAVITHADIMWHLTH